MGSKPLFCLVAVYQDAADAEADCKAFEALHSAGLIGPYDSAIVSKDPAGELQVRTTEEPSQGVAFGGLAAGAAVAVAEPVAMPALVAAGGAGFGAWIAHVARGLSRSSARELGETLAQGDTALIVVGAHKDADRVRKAAARAIKRTTRRIEGDYEQADADALATAARAEHGARRERAQASEQRPHRAKAQPSHHRGLAAAASRFGTRAGRAAQ
jgi:uncharacterized membrane protein